MDVWVLCEVGAYQGQFSLSPRSGWLFGLGFFLLVFCTCGGLPQRLPPTLCTFASELSVFGWGTIGLESYKKNHGSQTALSLNPSGSCIKALNLSELLSGK